ncbi:uncharacterized protein LOC113853735 isoform X2 [Abrus precatorius]|uniref:Uncharacterized protein LOC113853735 isoform X2 n=1 Tax=Abrus precatorius TaxID=3816 RepID=A0A8B8K8Q1_ABRPR|nr:uncharacterized protein LOC113853735 isoform X2 [Abrus precatorius]
MVCEESSSDTAPSSEFYKIASVDSSFSSAESSFRELDDAFLQTQARIWLGEVLQIRLDEQIIISELLADGELLFQVSKVVWKFLLAKHMELRHSKFYKNQPFASKKISGRYRPYSNVDSFLKICKILGLTGVDLFSPSDVVERRNTRRVCMCIRSFSKKSRSMNINVPDFDIVTCMVAMPKDLVGCIRRSIELSHSILADSSDSYCYQKHARGKSRQGYSATGSTRDCKPYSDQSEYTENQHLVLQFDGLGTDDLYDYTSETNYDVESPMVEFGSVYMPENFDQLGIQNQHRNEDFNDDFELLCSMESLQCHCSKNVEHDCELIWSSSHPFGDLRADLIGMTSHLDNRVEKIQESRFMDFDYFEHVLSGWTPSNDRIPCTIDASSHANDGKDPDLFQEGNSTPNVPQSVSSHGSNPTPNTTENGNCFEIGDNMEVAGMSCLSREALNLGDQFDAENNCQNIESFKLNNDKSGHWDKIKEEHESQGIMKCKEMAYGITYNERYSYFVKKFEETEHSLYCSDWYFRNSNSSDRTVPHSNDISSTSLKKLLAYEERNSQVDLKCLDNASCNQSGECPSDQSYYLPESCKWDQKGKFAMTSYRNNGNKSSPCILEDGLYEETTPCKQKTSEILMSKVMLSSLRNEDVVSGAAIELGTDGKELNNDCLALASNSIGVDDSEKCPNIGDEVNDFCKGVATQYMGNGDGGQKILLDLITNNVVPVNCDDQRLKLELNDGHQACQYEKDPFYLSEHTHEEIKPDDDSLHSLEKTDVGAIEIPKEKTQKRLLLRSVLGGAAAVGLLVMVLHLRRNGGEKAAQPSMASSHKGKEKIQKKSPLKVKRISTTKGIYPAEKLKLK